jgi:hypothetical protein
MPMFGFGDVCWKDRPSCVGQRKSGRVARENVCYAGSGGQGGNVLRIEELMTRSGQGIRASWIGNA